MTITWNEDLATGVDLIDSGLKTIIYEINAINNLDKEALTEEQIEKIIRFFGGQVMDHFESQEEAMLKYKYPDYDSHKEEHMQFLKNFVMLKKLFKEERSPMLMITVIEFEYLNWLVKHIQKFDKETATFLNNV